MKKTLNILVFFFCLFIMPQIAITSDYATERANSSPALDIINADIAYQFGYTGQGVTLGVIDTLARADHPDFDNKMTTYVHSDLSSVLWNLDTHGSHVAGIMAAARNGIGMHGVAYDANLHNTNLFQDYHSETGEVLTYPHSFSIADFFASSPDMRIVNNSWGAPIFPVDVLNKDIIDVDIPDPNDPTIKRTVYDIVEDFKTISEYLDYTQKNPEIVTVFAGGNDGHFSPTIWALLPRYYGLDLANWLNVGSLNSYNITQNGDGSFNLSPLSISTFSNLAAGAERWTVYAPGSYILSVDARTNGFYFESGTSMAAPVVSGALGLVQQAYPWMNGKQLTDAILTTTNTNFTVPQFTLGFTFNSDFSKRKLTFYSIDDGLGASLSQDEAKALLADAYSQVNPNKVDLSQVRATALIESGQYEVIQLTKEQVFGRGILDVGKAVQGIALLDVNRLTQNHALNMSELGGTYAMEAFDTKGYFATFSNDISQEKWNDTYHHEIFRTTGTYNEDALALDGLDAGIIKQGLGTLMLQGTNDYTGPTLIEGGILGLMPRLDGSGGTLSESEVIVRTGGTFYSSGGTVSKGVQNSGLVYVAHGLRVDAFSQAPEGLLQLEISENTPATFITANSASLGGELQFALRQDFYDSAMQVAFEVFDSSSINGAFSTTSLLKNSPTLSATNTLNGSVHQISVMRPNNAYTQYATNKAERAVGNALFALAPHAEGDMQTLISALDFSNPNGSDVKQGLNQLGTQTQNQLAQAGLKQQGNYNFLLMHRMLKNTRPLNLLSETQEKNSGIPAGSSLKEYGQRQWELWGSVIGSGSWQGEYDGYDGWKSSSVGMLLGADYAWQEGVTTGFHMSFSTRKTYAEGNLDSVTDTQSFSLGLHSIISPKPWDNWYIMAQGRIGFENNSQERTVAFADYLRKNSSEWTDFVGSTLIGGGKSWHMGNFSAGPVLWLEYSFLQRPEISESGHNASTLNMESMTYDSLRTGVDLQVEYSTHISKNLILDLNGLVAWRHELLDGTLYTQATFNGYEAVSFTTETPLMGRNTFLAQTSVRFNHVDNYFLELHVGTELSDANAHTVNVGLQLGYNF